MMEVLFRKSELPSLTVECQPATVVLDRHTSFFLNSNTVQSIKEKKIIVTVPDTVLCFNYKYRFVFVV